MPVIKALTRLEDWFDAFIVVCAGANNPSAIAGEARMSLSAATKVFILGTVEPGRAAGDLHHIKLSGPLDESAAQTLTRTLRDKGVRRPLIWVENPAALPFLAHWPDAFKVMAAAPGDLSGEGGQAIAAVCDLAIADTQDALAALILKTAYGGRGLAWREAGFSGFEACIGKEVNRLLLSDKTLNILMLYDDAFTHIKPVWEHLQAFGRHSRHKYFYLPAANDADLEDYWPTGWDFEAFDAIVWHYGLRAAIKGHISTAIADKLAAFTGLKVLFIQDEYDHVENTWESIRHTGIDLVMTCAPTDESARLLYPLDKTLGVELLQTLTGYVPEEDIEQYARPMEDRHLRLSYRGRVLAHRYGDLGRDKYLIGARMKALAADRQVPVDIEVDDHHRIYGEDWYRFQASARATLASESGANVADFDGSLKVLNDAAVKSGMSYEDFHAAHLADRDGTVKMNQVSPKIFEAIRLRTALVCFEGAYSGVIQPHLHYIPLMKDFSNVDEVFAKLEDIHALTAMTERAYRDVIESGAWSQRAFIEEFDTIVQTRVLRPARNEIIAAPIALRRRGEAVVQAIRHLDPFDLTLNTAVLQKPVQRDAFKKIMARNRDVEREQSDYKILQPDWPPEDAVLLERLSPTDVRPAFDGAVAMQVDGAHITTSSTPWTYAALINLDLSAVAFAHEHCWAHIWVKTVGGGMLVGSYIPNIDDSLTEQPLANGADDHEVCIPIFAGQTALLFRNGEGAQISRATFLRGEVLTAPAYDRGPLKIARQLISENIPLSGGQTFPPQTYQLRRPAEPPETARVVFSIDGLKLGSVSSVGGDVQAATNGAMIKTPVAPWSFGAVIELDLSGIWPSHEFCWLKVTLAETFGDLRLALWDRSAGDLVGERPCLPSQGMQTVLIAVTDADHAGLLIRTGANAEAAYCIFVRAELITMSRYPAALTELLHAMVEDLSQSPAADPEAAPAPLLEKPYLLESTADPLQPDLVDEAAHRQTIWRRVLKKLL